MRVATLASAAATACLLKTTMAFACLGSPVPDHWQLKGFTVLVVEVTGAHLTAYEGHQLIERGHAKPPDQSDGIEYLFPTSSTPEFTVNVLVDRVVSGKSEPLRQFTLGGCGTYVPQLREKGIIFIPADGSRTGVVWASQSDRFSEWAQELGLAATKPEP